MPTVTNQRKAVRYSGPAEKSRPPKASENRYESVAFPVGSIFLSVVSTDPYDLLGYGTWSQIAQGQMLTGFKSGDADFGTVEGTGGSKTANIAHTHDIPTLSHTNNHSGGSIANATTGISISNHSAFTHASGGAHTHDSHTVTPNIRGAGAGDVLTAPTTHSSDGGHTHDEHPAESHSITDTGHTHVLTQPSAHGDHTGTTSSGLSASQSIINPYFVIYVWKRTA